VTHPKVGEWWCPGRWRGRTEEGDTYAGCDGASECDVCHGQPMSAAIEGRVEMASWWEREGHTYKGRMLRGWANLLASRYGRPVYLTGGVLKDAQPRDIDVRVVLSRSEFEARFGKYEESGRNGYCVRLEAMDEERRWHVEIAKMNKQGASNTHLPIDFQCQPLREAVAYLNEQRVRLDDVPGLVPPWED
jgi:hypothetical protein